jgi:peroxiredoxin
MVTQLMVGKPAPDIAGMDLEGREFSLSEYRGQVVVLAFTAEWCAICRTQIPYEQFLRSKYESWPPALLGVQAGSSRDAARQKQESTRVPERSWWDVPAPGESAGAIAAAWNVVGWPATYVIDHEGVIRFVDVRDEDLLKAVRQLLEAQQAQQLQAARR